ncbi:ubiquinone biosynthesis protein COQ9 [Palleronia aestuarii]|uniref:Ubiquinone biosynthesis protein COQ9 n=1 Tax=Palleronia aestuarii TaxID=568105 RepID=A0A2W7NER5_9RHOB|nr:COQ9 family protein [Palleronia aestuarii]PZX16627.1 ubiquinone biosynthesis protein COQ9 [Palleronia aestuarii]
MTETEERLLDAALTHVPFDGWSEATLARAARDADVSKAEARALFPRGAVDLALAFHRRGDAQMAERLSGMALADMRFRDRVAEAIWIRLEVIPDREAVRRGTTLFALPQYSADGAKALWGTADRIWTALGDRSDDINWYTKRATLAGVYGSTVLYWLGDDSYEGQDTRAFIDRRIEDVMRIEKAKAAVRANPVLRTVSAGPLWALSKVRAPARMPKVDLPGRWRGKR